MPLTLASNGGLTKATRRGSESGDRVRVIRQSELIYALGSRRKVYEIDLCEVGPGAYVVNFRYGREGAVLKDGSKTLAPVPRQRAEFIFEALLNTQLAKGYTLKGQGAAPSPIRVVDRRSVGTPPQHRAAHEAAREAPLSSHEVAPAAILSGYEVVHRAADREGAILARLRLGDIPRAPRRRRRGAPSAPPTSVTSSWPLDRAIWRAGELRLRAAAPLIVAHLGHGSAMRDYASLYALARCGEPAVIPDVEHIYQRPQTLEHVRRVAGEALRALYGPRKLEAFLAAERDALPPPLRQALVEGAPQAIKAAALAAFEAPSKDSHTLLRRLYLIDGPARPAVLELAATLPLKPNTFKGLRGLLKSAELREDAQLWGILNHRFEVTRAYFQRPYWGKIAYIGGHRVEVGAAQGQPNAKAAYSSATRQYLRRRAWRTLERIGERDDPHYVNMAVGYLLRFKDTDAYGRINREGHNLLAPFLGHWAFNQILYRHSARVRADRAHLRFSLSNTPSAARPRGRGDDRRPSAAPIVSHEGAYPRLWAARPEGLIHLLVESRCAPVHDFAARTLRALRGQFSSFDDQLLALLLGAPYEITNQLGLELATSRFNPASPSVVLALAAIHSPLKAARDQARDWLEAARAVFTQDALFLADLLCGPEQEARRFGRGYLQTVTLSEETAQLIVTRLIARLLDADADQARKDDISATLKRLFSAQLRRISEAVILDLLKRQEESAHVLAGEILLARAGYGEATPEALLVALLDSRFSTARAVGVQLMARMPDAVVAGYMSLIVALSIHSEAQLRESARLVVQRVAAAPTQAEALAVELVRALLRHKLPDGAGAHLVRVLSEDLRAVMDGVPKSVIMRLLQSSRGPAQELGGLLLPTALRPDDLSVSEIARLGTHEIAAVRRAAWAMYRADIPRLKAQIVEAVRILDAAWEDTRQFAFELFGGDAFEADDFPPSVLVSLCDSVRPDVQRFGQGLLTRFFREAFGPEYLLKLSEHPSAAMQGFVTHYLERYAHDAPQRLAQLKLYFIAALSRVNQGGLTKQRVLRFFAAEARASREAAEIIAEILTRQSATIAIRDRAAAIEIMLQIHRDWPDVSLPIKVQAAEVRGGVSI